MRAALALAALIAGSAAYASPQETLAPKSLAESTTLQNSGDKQDAVCRDTIHQARADRGLPALDRGTADPDQPYFIAAVDKWIGGCSVMVMKNDLSDIRPLPKTGTAKGLPALQ